jgi:hypothetical protein
MQNHDEDKSYNPNLYVKSDWIPPNFMLPRCIPGRLQDFHHTIQRAAKTKNSPSNLLRHQLHALDVLGEKNYFLIVQCDKNLGPSVMERVEYVQMAIRDHLYDTNTYRRLSRFENTLAAGQIRLDVKDFFVRHKYVLTKNERNFISHCINTNKDPFAAFYLTMKVHKTPLKSRPIVSCSGSILFSLGKWFDDKLKIFAHRQSAYFKSSQDLHKMLSAMVIPPHTFFFTSDSESMYTNIDTNRALAYISSYIRDHAAEFEFYSVEALVEALKIVMKNSIFTFGDTYWRQDSGTAMGTPPEPQWANIFYALCENQFVPQFFPNLIFYKRFIDDVLGLWAITDSATNTASWESYIQAMNSEDCGLTWILSPLSQKVDFMDLTLRIDGASITTTLYEKLSNFHLYIPPTPVTHQDFSEAWCMACYTGLHPVQRPT